MSSRKILKKFIVCLLIVLLVPMGITVVVDPFYHYHKPLPFLHTVLDDKEYQVSGTIRNFDYDTVIMGSSIIENLPTTCVDSLLGGKSIKVIKSSGRNSDLCFYLDECYKHQDIKTVIYSLSFEEMLSEKDCLLPDESYFYLVDNNPINDVEYLLNKDVLLKRIPKYIASSVLYDSDTENPYSWASEKEFSLEAAMSVYTPYNEFCEQSEKNHRENELVPNLEILGDLIVNHPETTFYLYMTPYSAFWWNEIYRQGEMEATLFEADCIASYFSQYKNVKFYSFLYNNDMTFALDTYMDTVHFEMGRNIEIVERMVEGIGLYDEKTYYEQKEDFLNDIVEFSERGIREYYPDAVCK